MIRRSPRRLAVSVLAIGSFLYATATATAQAAGATEGKPAQAAARPHCATAPPAPNLPPGAVDPRLLWPQQQLDVSPAGVWYLNRGQGVTVAVVDTGVDPADPVFAPGAVLPGPSVLDPGDHAGAAHNADKTDSADNADYDCDGHGTAVAAIIAGKAAGLFGFSGVAPEARILPIRDAATADSPSAPDKLAAAIRAATATGVRIINVSIGVTRDSPELRAAVQNALGADELIVAAVGPGPKSYPAALPGVLAVGGIDSAGVPLPHGSGVMVSAPGGTLAVPAVGHPEGLTMLAGPGLAAPFVSGVAALVLSSRPGLHNWQVAQRLEVTADPPAPGPAAPTRAAPAPTATSRMPNPLTGYGIVDPYRAVAVDLPDEARPGPSAEAGLIVASAVVAVPRQDPTAARIALAVSAAGVLALAAPVALAASRRGRVKGSRAGV